MCGASLRLLALAATEETTVATNPDSSMQCQYIIDHSSKQYIIGSRHLVAVTYYSDGGVAVI